MMQDESLDSNELLYRDSPDFSIIYKILGGD
jgi:hypothetical protein